MSQTSKSSCYNIDERTYQRVNIVKLLWNFGNMYILSRGPGAGLYFLGTAILYVLWTEVTDLTHLSRDNMAAIFQTFSNAFSWIKIMNFD